ncbi:Protein ECM3 [Candida viswanathii]|uniref:Protein ECM3 n=1 Tax=Candida viswanathii TaxID=5486 RepID=A0A367XLP8_9ASCO|nr:Protein ECM3 [Candida viswanathii]
MSDGKLPLGLVIYSAVKPIFKIYFIIALGFFLAKRNILSVATCRDLSDTVVTAIMPCLIFNNIVSYLKSSDIKFIGIIFFTGTLLFLVGGTLAYCVFVITKAPKRWMGGLISVGIFPNISDLPIAYLQTFAKGGVIFTTAQGEKGVAYVCIFLMVMVMYQFSFGLFRLIEYDFRDELLDTTDEEEKVYSDSDGSERNPKHPVDANTSTSEEKKRSRHNTLERQDEDATGDDNEEECEGDDSSISSRAVGSDVSLSTQEDLQHQEFLRARAKQSQKLSRTPTRPEDLELRPRSSHSSDVSVPYSLHLVVSRTSDLRRQQSQTVKDVINEYSEFDALRSNDVQRTRTATSELAVEPKSNEEKSKVKAYLKQLWKNILSPNSLSLIISIAIAMAPPLKALFIKSSFYIPNAPDELPPLSFVLDFTSYVGAASVPIGLILLGATLARLQVKKMPPGFWKTAVLICVARLVIIPIFGVGLTTGFNHGGWYGDDYLVRFVSVLEFGLPNATSLVYFTAFYTDPAAEEHLQMDCLAICLICQYLVLWISLPFLTTFTLKVSLGL